MKITMCFEATSMAHLKDQLLQAFGSINAGGGEITSRLQNINEELTGDQLKPLTKMSEKIAAPSVYGNFAIPQQPEVKVEIGHLAKSEDVPVFNQAVAQAEEANKIGLGVVGIDVAAPNSEKTVLDGYTVSDGKVWVPVEGRSSAFTGIPMERYLAQKAAKEAGAELDSKGVPYDATIHTATKLKTQSGEWKKKPVRGAKTEAAQPQWQPPVTTQAPPVQIPVTNEPTVAMPFTQFPPAEQAQQTPVIESLAPAIGNAPPMYSYESFKKNLGKITMILANQGKIDRNYLMQLAAHFGVNEIWDIVEPKHEANCRILYNSFIEHGLILGA